MSGIIDGFAALLSSAGASSWDHLVVQDGSRRPAIASQLQATTSSFCHFRMHPWAVYKDARPPQCESGRHLQTALLSFKSKNLRRIQTQTKSFPVTSLKAWPTSSLHPPPIMPLPGPRAQSKPEVQAVSAAAPGPRKNRAEACGSMGGPWCHESRLRGGGQVHV